MLIAATRLRCSLQSHSQSQILNWSLSWVLTIHTVIAHHNWGPIIHKSRMHWLTSREYHEMQYCRPMLLFYCMCKPSLLANAVSPLVSHTWCDISTLYIITKSLKKTLVLHLNNDCKRYWRTFTKAIGLALYLLSFIFVTTLVVLYSTYISRNSTSVHSVLGQLCSLPCGSYFHQQKSH